jgi:hypothetical protein
MSRPSPESAGKSRRSRRSRHARGHQDPPPKEAPPQRPSAERPLQRLDLAIVVVLAIGAAIGSYTLSSRISPEMFGNAGWDTYFEADLPRIYRNLSDPNSDHSRVNVHPLYSLIAYPQTQAIIALTGQRPLTAMRLLTAAVAACWISVLYVLLKVVFVRRADSLVITA